MKHYYNLAYCSFNIICLSKIYTIRFILSGLLFLLLSPLEAQVIIKTESTPDIAVCQSPEKLEIKITANTTFTEYLTVSVQLPLGISYVPQSLEIVESPANLEIIEVDVSDVSEPIFQINASVAS
ncbi:MAG: hypothetical protein AB8B69_00225, partial [Chitinophagales bacterium]